MANIVLADDGTLDTVIECLECGEQFRFSFASWAESLDDDDEDDQDDYDAFVEWCIEDVEAEHECDESDDDAS